LDFRPPRFLLDFPSFSIYFFLGGIWNLGLFLSWKNSHRWGPPVGLSSRHAPCIALGLARRGGGVQTPLPRVYKPHSDNAAVLPVVVPLALGKPRRVAAFLTPPAAAHLSTAPCWCSSTPTEPSPTCHCEATEADERCRDVAAVYPLKPPCAGHRYARYLPRKHR
jgi:hypothetical protein